MVAVLLWLFVFHVLVLTGYAATHQLGQVAAGRGHPASAGSLVACSAAGPPSDSRMPYRR